MSILADKNTRLLVQGITGSEGAFHTTRMIEYGTQVVAGVTPGKGGQKDDNGIPIFHTVAKAKEATGANASVIFVPPAFAADAISESVASELDLVVCITEGIPTADMVPVKEALNRGKTRLVGPNCPGVITPGQCKVGIMPGDIHQPGPVGVISRSGGITSSMAYYLAKEGIGATTLVHVGGDPVVGLPQPEVVKLFEKDPDTKAVAMFGEIGGTQEGRVADLMM